MRDSIHICIAEPEVRLFVSLFSLLSIFKGSPDGGKREKLMDLFVLCSEYTHPHQGNIKCSRYFHA